MYCLDFVQPAMKDTTYKYMVVWFFTEAGALLDGIRIHRVARNHWRDSSFERASDEGTTLIEQIVWGRYRLRPFKFLDGGGGNLKSGSIKFDKSENGWISGTIDLKWATAMHTSIKGTFRAKIRDGWR